MDVKDFFIKNIMHVQLDNILFNWFGATIFVFVDILTDSLPVQTCQSKLNNVIYERMEFFCSS